MTMDATSTQPPITAIVYGAGEEVDPLLCALAGRLAAGGVRIAGMVQHAPGPDGRRGCDMELHVLPGGERMIVSQDRGPGARGCRLDHGLLLDAIGLAEQALPGADLLILNRFGKVEADGGGGRDLIVAAVALGIPVVLAVPWRNIMAFRAFAGELAQEVGLAAFRDSARFFHPDAQRGGPVHPAGPRAIQQEIYP